MDLKFTSTSLGIFEGTWNDFTFDSANDLNLVTGVDYVKQKVVKALLTPFGSDFLFPGYGTDFVGILHGDISDPTVQNKVVDVILGVISYLEEQEVSPDPAERIAEVNDIQFTSEQEQGTIYVNVQLTLQNADDTSKLS